MGEDDLKNLKELNSKNKPRVLTMYFEDGGETSVVPYDDYYDLQQENQQLKEQLNHERDDFKKIVKLGDKELKESIDNLKGTQFLDAFCILNWVDKTRKENQELVNQLKQRNEVINEAIEYVKNRVLEDDFMLKTDTKMVQGELLEILQEYKGD